MPSVMPVATAPARISFDAYVMLQTSVVTPFCSLNSRDTKQGSPTGMDKPLSPGSKYSWWTIFDEPLTSLYVPKKPNCLPSSRFLHCHLYLPPTRTSMSHTAISQPSSPECHFFTSSGLVCAS